MNSKPRRRAPNDRQIEAILHSAIQDGQCERLTETEQLATLTKIVRDHAVMARAIRRSQHYLRLALQPNGLSAKECITGLLQTLDNVEINEMTRR